MLKPIVLSEIKIKANKRNEKMIPAPVIKKLFLIERLEFDIFNIDKIFIERTGRTQGIKLRIMPPSILIINKYVKELFKKNILENFSTLTFLIYSKTLFPFLKTTFKSKIFLEIFFLLKSNWAVIFLKFGETFIFGCTTGKPKSECKKNFGFSIFSFILL